MGCCSKGPPAVPMFPLTFNVWYGTGGLGPPVGPPAQAAVPCQHVLGELYYFNGAGVVGLATSFLKMSKAIDLQWARPALGQDLVECPAGSGLYYAVLYVANMARGFTNEHRVATITPVGPFPAPLP